MSAQLLLFRAPPMPRPRIKRVVAHGKVSPPAPPAPPMDHVDGVAAASMRTFRGAFGLDIEARPLGLGVLELWSDKGLVDAYRFGFRHLPPDARARIHRVVRPGDGQVRGYYEHDGALRLWLVAYPLEWQEVDAAVVRLLGMELVEHQGEPGQAARAARGRR